MHNRLSALWCFGFNWAAVKGRDIEMVSKEKPESVPDGAELIHIESYGRKRI